MNCSFPGPPLRIGEGACPLSNVDGADETGSRGSTSDEHLSHRLSHWETRPAQDHLQMGPWRGVKSTWPGDAAARTHRHTGVAQKHRGMASGWNSNNARKIYISVVLSLQNRSRGASTQLWCRTQKMIMFSHTVRLSANYGDAGPRLQYSHVNSTLGIARLCYSHFRLQVWDGKGRASGGRRRGKVFSLGTIGEREIRAVGLLSSPCILQDSVYINIYVIIFCLVAPDDHQQGVALYLI